MDALGQIQIKSLKTLEPSQSKQVLSENPFPRATP